MATKRKTKSRTTARTKNTQARRGSATKRSGTTTPARGMKKKRATTRRANTS